MPLLEERAAGCHRCQAWTQVVVVGTGRYSHTRRQYEQAAQLCGPCLSALLTGLVDLLVPTLSWVDGQSREESRVQALERKVAELEAREDHHAGD